MDTHSEEVAQGRRYEFGRNWQRFLRALDDERILQAEKALKKMLQMETLEGKTFLDVGSGSGLFSLAAVRLRAERVHSFDYDPQSVACAQQLKYRYFPRADEWTIEEGDVLDTSYLSRLGQFDIVYSWGVLHHTGKMWLALKNVASLVSAGGSLFIAIYNDQGRASRLWKVVKILYNRSFACRLVITPVFLALMVAHGLVLDLIEWKNPFSRYRDYKERRGMSAIPDVFDWLGGYPFEFARPDQVFRFYRELGFSLVNLTSCGGGRGNNQYVFMKDPSSEPRLRERARQHSGKRARIQQAYSDLTALEFPN